MPPFVSFEGRGPALLPEAPAQFTSPKKNFLLTAINKYITPTQFEMDTQTAQWLIDLRNPKHTPAMCNWVDGAQGEDRCAVGWLLERSGGQWQGRDGYRHTAYKSMCVKYGKRLIRDVVSMHDNGVSWLKIADYVERKLRGVVK
jgi:hypothetical protein